LLARNRGDAPPSRPAVATERAPAAVRASVAPKLAPIAAPSAPAATADEPIDFGPRAAAPEKNIDLQAMRHLANLSAKSAIITHDSKRLSGTSRIKLAVTLLACLTGTVLLWLSLVGGVHLATMLLAVASFSVAVYWGSNYISLARQITGVRKAHVQPPVIAGDETPADAATESPAQTQEAVVVA
jgi:hypothetical protein